MRDTLKNLIEKTFILKYKLPYGSIDKLSLTTNQDYCFESDETLVGEAIYSSIIDYCLNEIEIDLSKLDSYQVYAIENKLRYDSHDSLDSQLKYGFFGETLLNIIINYFFHTKKIIAKGHFYSPLDKSEPKGYDSFHFMECNNKIEFWLGSQKCTFHCHQR